MNKNEKRKKKCSSQTNQNPKEDKKKPLFKIFMEENSKKKLHLLKGNITNSKDYDSFFKQYKGDKFYYKNHLNLKLFSYRVLEAKHNSTPELYLKKCLNILIKKKKSHLLAYMNELHIITGTLKEYLKRFYTYKEVKERIPKYVSYYKNYLAFFCRPYFVNYILNKKMVRHMEKLPKYFIMKIMLMKIKKKRKKIRKKRKKILKNIYRYLVKKLLKI